MRTNRLCSRSVPFKAGEVFNIIPDKAVMIGTVRTFDQETRTAIFARIEEVCRGVCAAAGASFLLEPIFGPPPVVNDHALADLVAAWREALGQDGASRLSP